MSNSNRLLILSDGKPGHVNQSIAFAKHLGYEYDLCRVSYKSKAAKLVYLADRCGFMLDMLYHTAPILGEYRAIVSAGSETYYPNRVLANRLGIKSVAIMLPQGYKLDFDLIVAQEHDNPPQRENIISLPINLTYVEPQGLVKAEARKRYVSIVIGGNSKYVQLDTLLLKQQLETILALFPEHSFWLTTSRRTPTVIEVVLKKFTFDRAVYYSTEQINPIPDFLHQSEYVFLTADSTSMISEAVSYGTSNIEILPLASELGQDKFSRMISGLCDLGLLHLFDGTLGARNSKVSLSPKLRGVKL